MATFWRQVKVADVREPWELDTKGTREDVSKHLPSRPSHSAAGMKQSWLRRAFCCFGAPVAPEVEERAKDQDVAVPTVEDLLFAKDWHLGSPFGSMPCITATCAVPAALSAMATLGATLHNNPLALASTSAPLVVASRAWVPRPTWESSDDGDEAAPPSAARLSTLISRSPRDSLHNGDDALPPTEASECLQQLPSAVAPPPPQESIGNGVDTAPASTAGSCSQLLDTVQFQSPSPAQAGSAASPTCCSSTPGAPKVTDVVPATTIPIPITMPSQPDMQASKTVHMLSWKPWCLGQRLRAFARRGVGRHAKRTGLSTVASSCGSLSSILLVDAEELGRVPARPPTVPSLDLSAVIATVQAEQKQAADRERKEKREAKNLFGAARKAWMKAPAQAVW